MKIAIVINGPPASGKDTVVKMATHIANKLGLPVHNISSVDKVKEAATLLGWDGKKDNRGRQFLSDLKDLSTNFYEGPLLYTIERFQRIEDGLVFCHIREPSEVIRLKSILDAVTLLVLSPRAESHGNHADRNVALCDYDHTILNDSSLDALQFAVDVFVTEITGGVR